MSDFCKTIVGTVEIQENGIIRDASGHIIGRLTSDVSYDNLISNNGGILNVKINSVDGKNIESTTNMPIVIEILQLNKPTKNGRIYTKKVIEDAINKIPEHGLFGYIDNSNINTLSMPLEKIAMSINNFCIKNDILMAEVKLLDTPEGKFLQSQHKNLSFLITNNIIFTPNGTGIVGNDGVVSDYTFYSISIIQKEFNKSPDIESIYKFPDIEPI